MMFFFLQHIIVVTRYLHVREQNVRWFFHSVSVLIFYILHTNLLFYPSGIFSKMIFPQNEIVYYI